MSLIKYSTMVCFLPQIYLFLITLHKAVADKFSDKICYISITVLLRCYKEGLYSATYIVQMEHYPDYKHFTDFIKDIKITKALKAHYTNMLWALLLETQTIYNNGRWLLII